MKLREELQTVGVFYAMAIAYWIAIGLMAPYWILYLTGLGLTYSQISLLFLMYPISSLVFEIPTGALADLLGRKVSVAVSYLLTGLAFVGALISGTNFSLLIFFYFLAGLSFTFESGALEAWFVDTVEHNQRSEHLHQLLARWSSISSVGFVIGPFLGGLLVVAGVDRPFWGTAVLMAILGIIVAVFAREEHFQRSGPKVMITLRRTLNTGKDGFVFLLTHNTTLILSSAMVAFAFAGTLYGTAYQPYVVQTGLPASYLGFALSAAGLVSIFSLNFSNLIRSAVGGNKRYLMISTLLYGLVTLGVGLNSYLPLLFVFLVANTVLYDLASHTSPAYREVFNANTPSAVRATVISANSFNSNIGQILGLFSFGFLSDRAGLQPAILLAGLLLTLTSPIYLRIKSNVVVEAANMAN